MRLAAGEEGDAGLLLQNIAGIFLLLIASIVLLLILDQ
jgi:hypothetical protein